MRQAADGWEAAARAALADDHRRPLLAWVHAATPVQVAAMPDGIVLLAAEGMPNPRIETEPGVSPPDGPALASPLRQQRTPALTEIAKGRGRTPAIRASRESAIVQATLHPRPPAATYRRCRTMAKAQGVGPSTVHRISDSHGMQPLRVKTFPLATDEQLVERRTDVAGAYPHPFDKVVASVRTKSRRFRSWIAPSRACPASADGPAP